ncbi:MAG: hypothetical protein HDT39_07555 [Lachnospiraceae bacterium]|nr:hypothetical protein [Lachnospiraceae bacterium]
MAMTPENYIHLEDKCDELCNECKEIVDSSDLDDYYVQEKAAQAYDKIVGLEKELEIAIRNIKTQSIRKKYEMCLENIRSYKSNIYFIAHIL